MKIGKTLAMAMLVGAAIAQAQTTVPSTAATSRTAPVTRPDLNSPRAALASLYTALQAGDIPAAMSCMLFQDARQMETCELTMTQAWGPMKLLRAMERRFGDAGRRPFANAAMLKAVEEVLAKVQQTEFQVDGTTAVAAEKRAAINPSAENELTGIVLRKDGEEWKVVAGSFADAASDLPASQVPMMRALHDAIQSACAGTCERVARGDFKTPEDAYADYQARLQTATAAARGPNHTGPTTQR